MGGRNQYPGLEVDWGTQAEGQAGQTKPRPLGHAGLAAYRLRVKRLRVGRPKRDFGVKDNWGVQIRNRGRWLGRGLMEYGLGG